MNYLHIFYFIIKPISFVWRKHFTFVNVVRFWAIVLLLFVL